MKIVINGTLFINSNSEEGEQEVTVGQSASRVELNFLFNGQSAMLRVDRRELNKVLEILDRGLM